MGNRRGRIEELSERIYSYLLWAYPRAHRRRYGQPMLQAFCDLCRDRCRQHGAWGLPGLWLSTLADTVSNSLSEHVTEWRTQMGTLKELLNRTLYSKSLNRSRGKWVFVALAFVFPILAVHSYVAGELQINQAEFGLSLFAAIACSLASILLGLAADRAPVETQRLIDRLADKRERRRAFWEMLTSFGILAFFLGSIEFLAEIHADRAQLLIGTLGVVACTFLLGSIWLTVATMLYRRAETAPIPSKQSA